jgi:Secretion system C-terminal sorting domain
MSKYTIVKQLIIFLSVFISCAASAQTRYFEFTFRPYIAPNWRDSSFIVATANQSVIDSVLVDIAKPLIERRHINGFIASGNGGYNKNASHNFLWHFVENQWDLQPISIEVCDGKPYTDIDLDTTYWLGTLKIFCPWGSKPSKEIFLPLAINENNMHEQISLYPNPATSNVIVLGKYGSFNYTVSSVTGQQILKGNSQNNRIDISQLNIGLYSVKIDFEDGKSVAKRIVKD